MPSLVIKIIRVWLKDWWSGRYKDKRLVTNTVEKLRGDQEEDGFWKDKLITDGV